MTSNGNRDSQTLVCDVGVCTFGLGAIGQVWFLYCGLEQVVELRVKLDFWFVDTLTGEDKNSFISESWDKRSCCLERPMPLFSSRGSIGVEVIRHILPRCISRQICCVHRCDMRIGLVVVM